MNVLNPSNWNTESYDSKITSWVNWLNIAEIELEILTKQCFNRRIDKINTVKAEVRAWQNHINNKNTKIKWQFSSFEARIKLHRLYLSIDV
jgi:hypothetical protein